MLAIIKPKLSHLPEIHGLGYNRSHGLVGKVNWCLHDRTTVRIGTQIGSSFLWWVIKVLSAYRRVTHREGKGAWVGLFYLTSCSETTKCVANAKLTGARINAGSLCHLDLSLDFHGCMPSVFTIELFCYSHQGLLYIYIYAYDDRMKLMQEVDNSYFILQKPDKPEVFKLSNLRRN